MRRAEQTEPSYLHLLRRGELARRVEEALSLLSSPCRVCPRRCRVDRRRDERGLCRSGRRAAVASAFPHFGEEDCLRGWRGSGTIFFSHCNLRCVFCQNFDISQGGEGRELEAEEVAGLMLGLQQLGCHNLNLVTPEHVVPQVLEALSIAAERGLRLPVVYNTSAYDSLESLRLLEGVVDIYMPDFKFWSPELAARYLRARDYPEVARAALREMHRQVGDLVIGEDGLARRGLLVRHLVMPGLVEETRAIVEFLAREISPHTYLNLMDQYYPAGLVGRGRYPEIGRRVTREEMERAFRYAREAGLYRFDRRRSER